MVSVYDTIITVATCEHRICSARTITRLQRHCDNRTNTRVFVGRVIISGRYIVTRARIFRVPLTTCNVRVGHEKTDKTSVRLGKCKKKPQRSPISVTTSRHCFSSVAANPCAGENQYRYDCTPQILFRVLLVPTAPRPDYAYGIVTRRALRERLRF